MKTHRHIHFPTTHFAAALLAALACITPARCASTPGIIAAACKGDLAKARALLKRNPQLVNAKGLLGLTPLHCAAQFGHRDVAELLLASGAKVNATDSDGETPLHWAARSGHKDIAELLLASGAEVNAKNHDGETPLHLAEVWGETHSGANEMAEMLRQHGGRNEVTLRLRWCGPVTQEPLDPLSLTLMSGLGMVFGKGCEKTDVSASSLVREISAGGVLHKLSYQGLDVIAGVQARFDRGDQWYVETVRIVNNTPSRIPLYEYNVKVLGTWFATREKIEGEWGKAYADRQFSPVSGSIAPGAFMDLAHMFVISKPGAGAVLAQVKGSSTVYGTIKIAYSIMLDGKEYYFEWLAPVQASCQSIPEWERIGGFSIRGR
jgi:hypothetical protein